VESDGPTTEAGGGEARAQANVVPFPGDWFGPRQELVPIGKRAYSESEQRHEDDELAELAVAAPPRPDAFWGEDSAEIHAVMPRPDDDERRGRRAAVAVRPRFAAFRAQSNNWLRSHALRVGLRSHALRLRLRSHALLVGLRSHTVRMAAGVALAVACAAVALASLGGSPAVDSNQPRATGGGGPAAGLIADGPAGAAIALALLRSNAQHRATSAKPARSGTSRHRPRRAVLRRRAPKTAARSAPAGGGGTPASNAPAATSEPVVSSQPASPAPAAPSHHSNGSGTTSGTSGTSGQTSSGSTARAASHHPSSVTPTGAAGALGPIGSPNG
jgi:hypothetical protein